MKRFAMILVSGALWAFASTPFAVSAADATVEIVSGGDTLTSMDVGDEAPPEVVVVGYSSPDEEGTTYALVLNTNGYVPAVIVAMGAQINEQWTYDATTSFLTLNVTSADFGGAGPFGSEGYPPGINSVMMFGIAGAVAEGQDGPPVEATGMYMATNIMQWEMLPPSETNRTFGFKLSGPEDHSGFFDFFVPNGLIGFLETTKEDLVLFVDDEQNSITFTDMEEGALFHIDVTFTNDEEESEESAEEAEQSTQAESETVTKEITTGEALPVSLAATETSVEKGKKVKLYGWVNDAGKGKKVRLMQKIGSGKFKAFRTMRTGANGYFSFKVPVSKTSKFKVLYKKSASPVKTVSVE